LAILYNDHQVAAAHPPIRQAGKMNFRATVPAMASAQMKTGSD
jgi:hypothetical protein